MGFEHHHGEWCVGTNLRAFKKLTRRACEEHCNSAACVCYQYKEELVDGNCRFTLAHEFVATKKSRVGFDAFLRDGATAQGAGAGVLAGARGQACGASSGASLWPSAAAAASAEGGGMPPFYVYPLPGPSLDALARCYAAIKRGAWPWGASQPGHLAAAVWVSEALHAHPARVERPELASVLVVPVAGALSEAVGSCDGTTHYERMLQASQLLRSSTDFRRRPQRHILVAAADTPRNLLGELGTAAAKGGAVAACLSWGSCGGFKPPAGAALLPFPPLAELTSARTRAMVDAEACGGGGRGAASAQGSERRATQLFFRGSLGRTKEAQSLRVRIALLRAVGGAEVRFTGTELLQPSAVTYAAAHKVDLHSRAKADVPTYVRGMLRSRFCLAPLGDEPSPGRRLFDAIAAGCVPILVGDLHDRSALPFSAHLDYSRFSASIPRDRFLADPVLAVEALLHKLQPQLPTLRKALADARQRLGYGNGDAGPFNSTATFGGAAVQLLIDGALRARGGNTTATKGFAAAMAAPAPKHTTAELEDIRQSFENMILV